MGKDMLAHYDPRRLRDFAALARTAGTEVQFVAYAGNASMAHYAGYAPRIACFGHVRENSHGYEVARLRVLNTLVHFVRDWSDG